MYIAKEGARSQLCSSFVPAAVRESAMDPERTTSLAAALCTIGRQSSFTSHHSGNQVYLPPQRRWQGRWPEQSWCLPGSPLGQHPAESGGPQAFAGCSLRPASLNRVCRCCEADRQAGQKKARPAQALGMATGAATQASCGRFHCCTAHELPCHCATLAVATASATPSFTVALVNEMARALPASAAAVPAGSRGSGAQGVSAERPRGCCVRQAGSRPRSTVSLIGICTAQHIMMSTKQHMFHSQRSGVPPTFR